MMRLATEDGKFPKVLVEGYQDTLFPVGPCQQFIVAGVTCQIAGPNNIVANGFQLGLGLAA